MLRIVSSLNTRMTSRESTPKRPEDACQLVGEGHLHRVEGVTRVLQRFRASNIDKADLAVEEREHVGQQVAVTRSSAVPSNHERRVEEVGDARPLAEKLGHIAVPTAQPGGSENRRRSGERHRPRYQEEPCS